jgi:hypothetical protein
VRTLTRQSGTHPDAMSKLQSDSSGKPTTPWLLHTCRGKQLAFLLGGGEPEPVHMTLCNHTVCLFIVTLNIFARISVPVSTSPVNGLIVSTFKKSVF